MCTNPAILDGNALEAAAIEIKDINVIVCPAKYPIN